MIENLPPGAPWNSKHDGGTCRPLPWRPSQKHNGNRTYTAISQSGRAPARALRGRPGRLIAVRCISCLLDILVTCR